MKYTSVLFSLLVTPAFTSVLSAEAAKNIQAQGVHRCSFFIDGLISISSFKEEARDMRTAIAALKELDLPVSVNKIQPPTQVQKYLGVVFDSVIQKVSIDKDLTRFSILLHRLQAWKDGWSVSCDVIASWIPRQLDSVADSLTRRPTPGLSFGDDPSVCVLCGPERVDRR